MLGLLSARPRKIIASLTHFFGMLKRQYDIQPKTIEVDNELTTQKPKVKAFLEGQFINVVREIYLGFDPGHRFWRNIDKNDKTLQA
jgi:hypothetical protein